MQIKAYAGIYGNQKTLYTYILAKNGEELYWRQIPGHRTPLQPNALILDANREFYRQPNCWGRIYKKGDLEGLKLI